MEKSEEKAGWLAVDIHPWAGLPCSVRLRAAGPIPRYYRRRGIRSHNGAARI